MVEYFDADTSNRSCHDRDLQPCHVRRASDTLIKSLTSCIGYSSAPHKPLVRLNDVGLPPLPVLFTCWDVNKIITPQQIVGRRRSVRNKRFLRRSFCRAGCVLSDADPMIKTGIRNRVHSAAIAQRSLLHKRLIRHSSGFPKANPAFRWIIRFLYPSLQPCVYLPLPQFLSPLLASAKPNSKHQ